MEFGGFMQHNRLSASWDDLNPSEEIDLSLRLGLPHHHNHQTPPPPFPLPQHHHHDQIIAFYQQCQNVSQRVKLRCAMCGKTETPLWRKGPNGPKTLCNGCGLRYARALKKH